MIGKSSRLSSSLRYLLHIRERRKLTPLRSCVFMVRMMDMDNLLPSRCTHKSIGRKKQAGGHISADVTFSPQRCSCVASLDVLGVENPLQPLWLELLF